MKVTTRLPWVALLALVAGPAFGQTSPGTTPDYFGPFGNYANSPLPMGTCSVTATQACFSDLQCPQAPVAETCTNRSGGMVKFQDPLPDFSAPGAIAKGTACSYPDGKGGTQAADCYTIKLIETTWKFHADLPAAKVRGYVEVLSTGDQPFSYLGPVIVATKDRPVRVTFINALPTGAGGNLFIPTDTTYMGAGVGPDGRNSYAQNRATLHLHGGTTPWISDGTVHQWTTPAGENTPWPTGVSVRQVPDMGAAIPGQLTFYYTNEQSARLMFYHDHALGMTRVNVYAGEAAGYLLTDPTEQDLITRGLLPGIGIPLVIQDKTFVPTDAQLALQDPTWDKAKWGGLGALWFPHVYMPNQNPYDISGANPMGRWDYGPWFWPPFTGLTYGPVPNPYFDPNCVSSSTTYCESDVIPGTPDSMRSLSGVKGASGVPEAFMDTPVVNGKAYPTLTVPAGKVRFRILNAATDRFFNLSFWAADPSVTYPASYTGPGLSEVKMVPWNSTQNAASPFPAWWYDGSVPNPFDDRVGGVPDPATRGPAWIQVGTEGGFLPAPAVIKNQPVNYVMNKRDITVGNVAQKALLVGPAERADVVVDFTNFAGKTLILYNDSPAPVPAADPRLDYFTGNSDQSDTGGASSTLPGYGPNTRTIMKITVQGTDSGTPGPVDDYDGAYLAQLQTELPKAFYASQDKIIVPQSTYAPVYAGTVEGANTYFDPGAYVRISDTQFTFRPLGAGTTKCAAGANTGGCVTVGMLPKSIIEDFQIDYGRMNAILGNEIPNTNVTNQTSIPQTLVDPPVELIKLTDPSVSTTLIGQAPDGTQLWKITHNGVDTHAIHFHMFNVQVVNRVGWDGAIRPPDANELGFKDTVRMNPLEDIVVATRPIKLMHLPWEVPNSIRLLDPTMPAGNPTGFTNVDPQGNPVTVLNQTANFGWEYVYHCHLLGHEENDMMRPLVVAAQPGAPTAFTASLNKKSVVLTWAESSVLANGFTLQRASDATFTSGLVTTPLGSALRTYTDNGYVSGTTWFYRLTADNTVGSAVPGYPQLTNSSAYVFAAVGPQASPPLAPTNLTSTILSNTQVRLSWTIPANNGSNVTGSFVISAVANGSTSTNTVSGTTNTFTLTVQPGTSYQVTVTAKNAAGTAVAGPITVVVNPPLAPATFTATAVRASGSNDTVNLSWSAVAGATGYRIQRATNSSFTQNVNTATVGTATSLAQSGLARATNYYYRVYTLSGVLASVTPTSATPFPVLTP